MRVKTAYAIDDIVKTDGVYIGKVIDIEFSNGIVSYLVEFRNGERRLMQDYKMQLISQDYGTTYVDIDVPEVNTFYIFHTNDNEYKIGKVLRIDESESEHHEESIDKNQFLIGYLVEFSNKERIECNYAFEPMENITKYYAKNVFLQEDVKAWNMRGKLFGIRMYSKDGE